MRAHAGRRSCCAGVIRSPQPFAVGMARRYISIYSGSGMEAPGTVMVALVKKPAHLVVCLLNSFVVFV